VSDSKQTAVNDHAQRMLARRELLRGVAVIGTAATAIAAAASRVQAELFEEGEYQCRAVPRSPQSAPAVDFDAFMAVSRVLTGAPLDAPEDLRIGREYLDRSVRLADLADNNVLPDLITAYQKLISTQPNDPQTVATALIKDDAARSAAQQLIYLWYLSAFLVVPQPDPKAPPPPPGQPPKPSSPAWVYGTPGQYEHALLWKVVRAHPPMMRGGPPGYWAERPMLPVQS